LPTCGPMCTFLDPYGAAQIPQNSIKSYFLVVLDYFSYNNEPIDSVRGLFTSLDIGTYMSSTCGPLGTLFGPFGGAQMPLKSIKKIFSGFHGQDIWLNI
jgi:hypothetical protein